MKYVGLLCLLVSCVYVSSYVHGPGDCDLPKETGPCMAFFQMYYYNKDMGKCEQFIYGGCHGNGNNFEDLAVCEATCVQKQN